MKKKLVAVLLTAVMALSLAACGGKGDGGHQEAPAKVRRRSLTHFLQQNPLPLIPSREMTCMDGISTRIRWSL